VGVSWKNIPVFDILETVRALLGGISVSQKGSPVLDKLETISTADFCAFQSGVSNSMPWKL
jgi:hypothetical protein